MADNRYDGSEYGLTDDDDYGYSLTNDDEKPLVSGWDDDDAPLDSSDSFATRPVRPVGRRETIDKIASDQQNGLVRTSGLRTQPDPRLAASRLGKLGDRYQRQNRGTKGQAQGATGRGSAFAPPGGNGGGKRPPGTYKK
ncbi:MAG: hypothetical protein FWB91_08560, partial [Defluviitaleaceae bacterium]|nr:hypothetical protein [Defluviitaleaceae bacterium]